MAVVVLISQLCFPNTDINECLPNGGLGPCAQICSNTIGSFVCSCQPGFILSGNDCSGKNEHDFYAQNVITFWTRVHDIVKHIYMYTNNMTTIK